jgi:DNA-binding transcriptional MerR regulator
MDIDEKLKEWCDSAGRNAVASWGSLPDIELYMDQVIGYIEKQLRFYQDSGEGKLITPSMINNYVKDGVILHASAKKYSREHVSSLLMTGILKQVLPLSRVKELLSYKRDASAEVYGLFLDSLQEALELVTETLATESEKQTDTESHYILAMKLACTAFAGRIASEKLLTLLAEKAAGEAQGGEKGKADKLKEKPEKQPEKQKPQKTEK